MLFFFFFFLNRILLFHFRLLLDLGGKEEGRGGKVVVGFACLFWDYFALVFGLVCWFWLFVFFLEKRWGCVSEKIRASQQFSQFLQHSLYCAILRLSLLGFFSVFTNNTNDTKVGLITGTLKDIAVYRIALLPLIDRWRV